MRHSTIITLIAAFAIVRGSQPVTADDDPRVKSLRENAVAFRSIEPGDDDFGDLQPLKAILGEARIVQLGEQSHGDGATFHAKTRLIRFLHQEMGFDVIAFESGLYDCRKAWEQFAAGAAPRDAAALGIFPIWTRSAQVQPLLNYLGESARTDRPLELCGFDCQFTGAASRTTLLPDFEAFVDDLPDEPVFAENAAAVTELIRKLQESGSPPSYQDQHRWTTACEALRDALDVLEADSGPSVAESAFWRRFLKSVTTNARIVWVNSAEQLDLGFPQRFNPRDAQMGDNMIWLARERYPERKIIVWAATMHIQHNPHLIDTRRADLSYEGVEPMGQHLTEALGDEVFTIGFTTYEGRAGLPWGQTWRIEPAPEDSFEDLCVRAGLENAFVSFRGPETPEWLRGPLVSRPLGHSPMQADWTQILDGMVFTRTMTPSTMSGATPRPQRSTEEQQAAVRDLVATIEVDWKRAQERIENGHAFADKVTFGGDYERWKSIIQPAPDEIAAMRRMVTDWFEDQETDAGLIWRTRSLLALMLVDEGDREAAHRQLDAALEAYPDKDYADPSKLSFFQHLANQKAMMVWDDEGLDAAVEFATELLAEDSRCHYFWFLPWRQRLEADGNRDAWSTIRSNVLEAYEQRAREFPEAADAIRVRAAQLPGDEG